MSEPGATAGPATAEDEAGYWGRRRTSFGGAADAYASGRPTYPSEALRWVLPSDAKRCLDLAAGTGRLTEVLLRLGLDVVAVEPLDEMRAHIPTRATALAGTAEAIPLDDASMDAVVVGQAFHWFDAPTAMAEIARVLRPGGRLGLMWNLFDDRDPWVDEWLSVFGGDERISNSPAHDDEPPYAASPAWAGAARRFFRHRQPFDAERAAAYVASRSQAILLSPDDRDALLARVRAFMPAEPVMVPAVCEAWRDTLR